jgi:Rps23 Pro-64 3,4-dihydroxylase Tpa1-like proline 4-hydroxylase
MILHCIPLNPNAPKIVPAHASQRKVNAMWKNFCYYKVYTCQFSQDECQYIVDLANGNDTKIHSIMSNRDCNLVWLFCCEETKWIFERLKNVVTEYNSEFGFDVSQEMGALQLTRYCAGQYYNWHMDLGDSQTSLRKISLVVELASAPKGGGLEIFYGDGVHGVPASVGDVIAFPSFIMHRALTVEAGERWSLVSWILGDNPLK